MLLLLLQPTQTKLKQQQPQQQQKTTEFMYENSTRVERVDCIDSKASRLHFSDSQCIYSICLIHMLQLIEILWSVTNGIITNQICPTFWINILQDLHGQSSHFQVLTRFLKRVREAASPISIGTCCQSWLARYGIASRPYYSNSVVSV